MTVCEKGGSPDAKDTRGTSRRRALLSGKIAYGGGMYSCDCTIRDISVSGARIGIPGATVLPKEFFLLDIRHQTAFDAEVVWRNATQTGLKFRAAYDLPSIADPNLRFLRDIFVESCLR